MEDAIATARVMFALAFYISVFVLPLALVGSALIRMALRWHNSWPLMSAATLAALPQAAFLVFNKNEPEWAVYGFTLLALASVVLLWRACRDYGGAKILLDIAIFGAALIYTVSGVSWIVG